MEKTTLLLLTLLTTLISYSQTETEPNNFFNSANTITLADLAGSIQGAISTNGDADYYKVTIPQSGVFIADIYNVPSATMDMEMTIYDSRQVEIYSNFSSNGAPLFVNQLVCSSGTYFFKINDRSNNDSSSNLYTFDISLDVSDVYECNNSFSTASTIDLDQNIQAKIRTFGDVDYYKVDITQAGVFVADITNAPSTTMDMDLVLYDSNQNQIANIDNDNGGSVFMRHLVCEAGTYFFKISDDSNNDRSENFYNFKISLDTQDVYECNNSFSTASSIALDQAIQAKIRTFGDQDYYKVDITQAGVFVADITNVPSTTMDMDLVLYDSNQNQIANIDNDNGGSVFMRHLVCEAGTYFFKISDDNNNDRSENFYNFKVSLDTSDIYECNNSFSTASTIALDQTIQAKIRTFGDQDYYKVDISQAGVFVADITNVPSTTMDMDLILYDANQNQIANVDNDNGGSVFMRRLVCEVGTYYFKISDDSNNDRSENLYNFKVSLDTQDVYECNNSFLDATQIDLCTTFFGAVYGLGDEDYFTFDGIIGQQVTIVISNIAENLTPYVSIYDASQNRIFGRSGNTGRTFNYSFTPSETQKYYLKIQENWTSRIGNNQLYELLLESNCNLSTNDILNESSFTIYPNPVKDKLTIQLVESLSLQKINIYNPLGQLLITVKSKSLDISKLAKGVYNIEIITNKGKGVKQFIKN